MIARIHEWSDRHPVISNIIGAACPVAITIAGVVVYLVQGMAP